MSASLVLNNLMAYSAQVLALVAAGGLLPVLLRIHQPWTQLLYFRLLLVASLFLPALQPWQRPVLVVTQSAAAPAVTAAPAPNPPPVPSPVRWQELALWVVCAGAAMRVLWLLVGMWRLRRLRSASSPLDPLPEAVEAAQLHTGVSAEVRLSEDAGGPVTFGARRPVVLLPPALLEQPYEAQFGIACHEFLHVRRRDWLYTVVEEFAGALVWFHPAVWWLLGQIHLVREAVVDREVVSLTEARDSYVHALLAMGGARPRLDLAPATLFLRKRHLANRIHSLLKEVTMSRGRLISSYVLTTAAVLATAWFAATSFPLTAGMQVQVQQGAIVDGPGVSVEPGGRVLHRPSVRYPVQALTQRIEGMVTLELAVNSNGEVTDARVSSGPEDLRRTALETVLQWHYLKDQSLPRTIQATIEFRLPPAALAPPPPAPGTTTVRPPVPSAPMGPVSIDVSRLPDPLQSMTRVRLAPYEGRPFTLDLLSEIQKAVNEIDSHAKVGTMMRRPAADGRVATTVSITLGDGASLVAAAQEAARAQFQAQAQTAAPADFPSTGAQRVAVGGAEQQAKLISQAKPQYPPLARQARIQGTVRFTALIGVDGTIKNLTLVSGHPLLVPEAQEAVKQWVYQPTLLNGAPVEVVTQIDVNFTLAGDFPPPQP